MTRHVTIGDRVVLKSGGPVMLVVDLEAVIEAFRSGDVSWTVHYHSPTSLICAWRRADGSVTEASFPPSALVYAKAERA